LIMVSCLAFFTVLMQLLHALGVNVLKVVVLMGTFALAMAFAGNDLVNFIGVPLSGLASYQDYVANGSGDPHGYLMDALNGPANTPVYFLIGAGAVMVVALSTSGKVRNVTKTAIGLSSQQAGDEMFGSSRIARRLVRWALSVISWVERVTPAGVRRWFGRRFDVDDMIMENGASFDLVRGSVNLVLAGALIAFGTSMKLPLSTTFVTFMVAMGTSLADRAWGRESAVFRITGVISVVGGWFLTAGAAFVGAGIIVTAMHYGGHWVMFLLGTLTVVLLIRSNRRYRKRPENDKGDALFQTIITTDDKEHIWPMLMLYITEQQQKFMSFAMSSYMDITAAFISDNAGMLGKAESNLTKQKDVLKSARRKETLCLGHVSREVAIEKSAWFYLSNNCCMGMLYNLRRINEVCKEHVDNNFFLLPKEYGEDYERVRSMVGGMLGEVIEMLSSGTTDSIPGLRRRCDELKDVISATYHRVEDQLHEGDAGTMTVLYVYVNMLQETQELVSSVRKYLRAFAKLRNPDYRSRR
ncbi:MAG: inorganic phosphate transporter, partial [Muribaculaceae bacterium]|nr:inorganic phosphate transporter [Muribaculaceae bacterium]